MLYDYFDYINCQLSPLSAQGEALMLYCNQLGIDYNPDEQQAREAVLQELAKNYGSYESFIYKFDDFVLSLGATQDIDFFSYTNTNFENVLRFIKRMGVVYREHCSPTSYIYFTSRFTFVWDEMDSADFMFDEIDRLDLAFYVFDRTTTVTGPGISGRN